MYGKVGLNYMDVSSDDESDTNQNNITTPCSFMDM